MSDHASVLTRPMSNEVPAPRAVPGESNNFAQQIVPSRRSSVVHYNAVAVISAATSEPLRTGLSCLWIGEEGSTELIRGEGIHDAAIPAGLIGNGTQVIFASRGDIDQQESRTDGA